MPYSSDWAPAAAWIERPLGQGKHRGSWKLPALRQDTRNKENFSKKTKQYRRSWRSSGMLNGLLEETGRCLASHLSGLFISEEFRSKFPFPLDLNGLLWPEWMRTYMDSTHRWLKSIKLPWMWKRKILCCLDANVQFKSYLGWFFTQISLPAFLSEKENWLLDVISPSGL